MRPLHGASLALLHHFQWYDQRVLGTLRAACFHVLESMTNATIYLSSRRAVAEQVTTAVFQQLMQAGVDIYWDAARDDSPGVRLDRVQEDLMHAHIAARSHVVALLTPASLAGIDNPHDPVRRELEWALDLERDIVLLLAYEMRLADGLRAMPASLQPLRDAPNIRIPPDYLPEAVARLHTRGLVRRRQSALIPLDEIAARYAERAIAYAAALPPPTEARLEAERELNLALAQPETETQLARLGELIMNQSDDAAPLLARARLFHQQGAYARAIADYTEAMQRAPEDPTIPNNRGLAHRQQGDVQAAIADYAAALALDDTFVMAYLNRGIAYLALPDYEAALDDFDAVLGQIPGHLKALCLRAWTMLQGAHTVEPADPALLNEALITANQAVTLDPQAAHAYRIRGAVHMARHDYAAAAADYEAVLGMQPDDADAHFSRGLARSLLAETRPDEAEAQALRAQALDDLAIAAENEPGRGRAAYKQGKLYQLQGDLAAAVQAYTQALVAEPEYAYALFSRGQARRYAGELDDALADFDAALRLAPHEAAGWYQRGIARTDAGAYEAAIADFTRALELRPAYAEALNRRGAAHYASGDLAQALADYDAALAINPGLAAAYNNRGAARLAQGDTQGAIDDYTHGLTLNPSYVLAYVNRGAALADQGDFVGAIADYTCALQVNPRHAVAYYNRGVARAAINDFEGSIEDYNAALELRPELDEAYLNRGLAHAARGRADALELAIADLHTYIARAGDDTGEVSMVLRKLERRRSPP
jgi:tetratricopeptide (TPR) repeat protein